MTRAAKKDYSHRSLFEKLGVTAEARAAVVGSHDTWFVSRLGARLANAASRALRARYDLILLRIDEPRDLSTVSRAAGHLTSSGALWVFHPKGRGATPGDSQVRAAGLRAGLVDNKICAYSNTHTATRFVVPLVNRR